MMNLGSNKDLVYRLVDAVGAHTRIGCAIDTQATWPIVPDYVKMAGQLHSTEHLRARQRFYSDIWEKCVDEIHRRIGMTPDEIDAEAAGLSLADLARVKAMHEHLPPTDAAERLNWLASSAVPQ